MIAATVMAGRRRRTPAATGSFAGRTAAPFARRRSTAGPLASSSLAGSVSMARMIPVASYGPATGDCKRRHPRTSGTREACGSWPMKLRAARFGHMDPENEKAGPRSPAFPTAGKQILLLRLFVRLHRAARRCGGHRGRGGRGSGTAGRGRGLDRRVGRAGVALDHLVFLGDRGLLL